MSSPVTFDRAMLTRLKKALAAAGGRDFVFEGNEMDPGYARYLIEYLEGQFASAELAAVDADREEEYGGSPAEYVASALEHGDLDLIVGTVVFLRNNFDEMMLQWGPELDRAFRLVERAGHLPEDFTPNLNGDQADAYDEAAEFFGGMPYERFPQRRGPLNGYGARGRSRDDEDPPEYDPSNPVQRREREAWLKEEAAETLQRRARVESVFEIEAAKTELNDLQSSLRQERDFMQQFPSERIAKKIAELEVKIRARGGRLDGLRRR